MGDRRISSINRYHSPVGSGASHQLSPLVDRMLWLFTPPLHHSQPAQWGPGSSQWPFKGCSTWPFQGWKRDLHLGYQKVTWKKLGDWFNIDLFFLVQTFFGSTIILEYLEHASGNWTFPSFPNRNIIKTLKLVRYFDVFQDGFIWTDTLRDVWNLAKCSASTVSFLGVSVNPSEKYARQIGSFPQVGARKKRKKNRNHHLDSLAAKLCGRSVDLRLLDHHRIIAGLATIVSITYCINGVSWFPQ